MCVCTEWSVQCMLKCVYNFVCNVCVVKSSVLGLCFRLWDLRFEVNLEGSSERCCEVLRVGCMRLNVLQSMESLM